MKAICAGCGRVEESELSARDLAGNEVTISRRCELRATSRLEVLVIDGRSYIRILKSGPMTVVQSVARKTKTPPASGALKKGSVV